MYRIAAAFNSPRYAADPAGLYDLLSTAITVECGVISSSLSFEQDDVIHEIEMGQSELHIEDTNPLTIYVPNDTDSQECCFKFDLPHRFASWLMTDPTTGTRHKIEDGTVNVINSILNCFISTTGRILEKEGIPDIPGIAETVVPSMERDEPAESTTMAVVPDLGRPDELLPLTPSRSQENERNSSPETVFSPPATPWSQGGMDSVPDHPTPLTDYDTGDSEDDSATLNDGDWIPPPRFRIPDQPSQSQYRQLLEKVVALGKIISLPNIVEDISATFQRLSVGDDPFEGVYYPHSSNDWEYRKRVGVAGELFVSKLGF